MMAKVNTDLFNKFQSAIKLPLRQGGDGSETEVDIREDEEQSVKLQEIIDLLVAAGYFRARIKGLSPFDKVVGGMTWCIQSCNIDVDVDLLFQENSTIGQKIALTEKIVAVLQKMKCPYRIEPHQIQGLDFIHIFPVIQWLVKRSMEFRQEMAAFVRSYAVNQFEKEFPSAKEDPKKDILENIKKVQEVYRPRRIYKRKNALPDDLNTRLLITLLEYGVQGKTEAGNIQESTEGNTLEKQDIAEHSIEVLLNNLTLMQEDVTENFSFNDVQKTELAKHYAAFQNELKLEGTQTRQEDAILTLKEQKKVLEDEYANLTKKHSDLQNEIIEVNNKLKEILENQKQSSKILKDMETGIQENPETLKETEDLVILGEKLRNQELQFREYCKQELVRLQNMIEETKASKQEVSGTTHLNKELQMEEEKLKELRLKLAKKNREVAALQRKLDEVPTSAELAQYQRRFLELYNEVSAKHKETKQYYTLYNTLEDTRLYIKNELSLLNSISDSYPEALVSNSAKEEFLRQLENIVAGVKQSRCKVESKLVEEKHKRDELTYSLQSLVDQQRRYVSVVRQLGVECRKHEILLSQIQS
ncbi:coiled-coil domain-containing protein 93 [Agrilus planipennis]|uniref:Coiled-coil domain-containing protein 93 n=1 Tax=Agrilus planipennis TaxID=224129 RepID=A0A7F5QVN1_AGRPL|nr:coiled-coil domain-containing protein 93 [Agrilus planipennis]